MRHWDLKPGETVTLRSGAATREARFLFRDTKIAAFQMANGDYREFKLRQSGSLRDPAERAEILGATLGQTDFVSASEMRTAIATSRVWVISGEDRNMRHQSAALAIAAGGAR